MSVKMDLNKPRTIRLTNENERFIQGIWVLSDKRYTDGFGPKINKCLDLLRSQQDLVQMIMSVSEWDIYQSEFSEQEREDQWDDEE